ncbi:MAG: protein of unknown function DUF1232 [Candidatus Jettenia ecosi]|uniref:Cupin type-1 domain-containing protein n=1 Tax=Candidatus Jettenia ecosi TaxID=2494326 RepID=A0A533QED0_9BACT|nr:MAG: protein of unknown function DUF1232 [Candidatus Jettenia ecosi]
MKIVSLSDLPEEGVSHNPEIKKKVLLKKDEIPNVTGFSQARITPGQIADPHAHDDRYEIFFFEEGKGIVRIDDKEYPVEKGICITIEPGEVHTIINTASSDLVLTYFGVKIEKKPVAKDYLAGRFGIFRKVGNVLTSKEFKRARHKAEIYAHNPEKTEKLLDKAVKKTKRKKQGPVSQAWQYLSALIRMVRAYIRGDYKEVPWESIVLSIAAIIYFVSPVDFMPDFIPVIGYLDDMAVIAFVVKSVKTDMDNFLQWENEQKEALK